MNSKIKFLLLLLLTSNAFASDLYVAYYDRIDDKMEQCHVTPMKKKEIAVDFRCEILMDYFRCKSPNTIIIYADDLETCTSRRNGILPEIQLHLNYIK